MPVNDRSNRILGDQQRRKIICSTSKVSDLKCAEVKPISASITKSTAVPSSMHLS